jgi:hypothetical protein
MTRPEGKGKDGKKQITRDNRIAQKRLHAEVCDRGIKRHTHTHTQTHTDTDTPQKEARKANKNDDDEWGITALII